MIDWNKPVETMRGLRVTILTTAAPGRYPVLGYCLGSTEVRAWTKDGRSTAYAVTGLRNVVEDTKHVTYQNVYREGVGKSVYTNPTAVYSACRKGMNKVAIIATTITIKGDVVTTTCEVLGTRPADRPLF